MDLINTFLNLVFPPFTFFTLLLFLPPFQIFKFFLSLLRFIFSEDVAGKVVLITGLHQASARATSLRVREEGACLALAARREHSLREVADRAQELGSPEVITIQADVAKVDDSRRLVEQAVNHFGRLDHLVNNAGIHHASMLEELDDVTNLRPVMDINFWGSVYTTRFAVPHLRNSGGKIIVMSSSNSWLPLPRSSVYNASKAAMTALFETLRIELGQDIHITLVTPGFIESELTHGKYLRKDGKLVLDEDMRDVQVGVMPVGRAEECAKAIVKGACRGESYVTMPAWFRLTHFWKLFCPELIEWTYRLFYLTSPGVSPQEAASKKTLDYTGAKKVLYPETIQSTELKTD
ncbi:11-beta-hydroxysteroid dehydrogenase [Bertholletia excelsa]